MRNLCLNHYQDTAERIEPTKEVSHEAEPAFAGDILPPLEPVHAGTPGSMNVTIPDVYLIGERPDAVQVKRAGMHCKPEWIARKEVRGNLPSVWGRDKPFRLVIRVWLYRKIYTTF